jgi:putative Holliday junction resolvase
MKLLGIDYGLKRIGLAVSDKELVLPLKTLKVKGHEQALGKIAAICQEERVDKIVLGLPLRLNGKLSKMARRVKKFGQALTSLTGLSVVYSEEQLTTKAASRLLRGEKPATKGKMRDQLAAALILKDYLGSI